MQNRFLSIAAAVGALALAGLLPQQASALTGVGTVELQAGPALVRQAGSRYLRRYDPHTGTYVRAPFTEVYTRRGAWVAAPFARVYSDRHGTWVRAPFVNLWVPR
jgi:hypothetical protein